MLDAKITVRWTTALLVSVVPLALAACGGGGSGGAGASVAPPAALSYEDGTGLYRVGEAATPALPSMTGSPATAFTIDPALPAGLTFDVTTGEIAGTPTFATARATHTITASNVAGTTQSPLDVAVGPPLPAAFVSLAPGFFAQPVTQGASKIAKAVLTADGRFIYTEVDSGDLRIIDPQIGLLPTPYASITVTNGGHQGLLGLALSPDFINDGFVYVQATVPGAQAQDPDQTVILRFTDDPQNNVGTNQTTMVSGLPVANINNGGELVFDLEGHLLVSLGDAEVPANAQLDFAGSPSGKLLRFDVSTAPAGVPPNNPFQGSPEWCRGLRNTFGLAVHPTLGTTLGADNGPTADDEVNRIEPGRNFEWGAAAPVQNQGTRLVLYPTVIVPTALTWHDGTNVPATYANNVFMTSYDDQKIRRFIMNGPTFADFDLEIDFAEFTLTADDNKPLDIFVASDGAIYVATFTGIWRIVAL